MENKEISNYSELVVHIMHLKQEKFRQEDEIKYTIRELIFLLNPVTMAKNALHDLASDSEAKFDMAKVGMDMVVSMLVNRLTGRSSGIKGFLGKLLLGKISSSLIYNNVSRFVSAIRNRIGPTPIGMNDND